MTQKIKFLEEYQDELTNSVLDDFKNFENNLNKNLYFMKMVFNYNDDLMDLVKIENNKFFSMEEYFDMSKIIY